MRYFLILVALASLSAFGASSDVTLGSNGGTVYIDNTQHAATLTTQGGTIINAGSTLGFINVQAGTVDTSGASAANVYAIPGGCPVVLPNTCKAFTFKTASGNTTLTYFANVIQQNVITAVPASALPVMVGDSGAGGVKGAVPAPAAGDTAANKFLKANGVWTALSIAPTFDQIQSGTNTTATMIAGVGSTFTLNTASTNIARTDIGQTFTGSQEFTGGLVDIESGDNIVNISNDAQKGWTINGHSATQSADLLDLNWDGVHLAYQINNIGETNIEPGGGSFVTIATQGIGLLVGAPVQDLAYEALNTYLTPKISNGNTITSLWSQEADALRFLSADQGTVTDLASNVALFGHNIGVNASAITTNAYGFWAKPAAAHGTITNLYGLKIDAKTAGGTVTNYYGIHQSDSAASNVLAGPTTFGITGTATGQAKFGGQTSGTTTLTANTAAGGTSTLPTTTGTLVSTGDTGTVTNTMLAGSITEAKISLTDNTTGNVSATAHGFAPKFPNNTTTFLRGDGTYAAPTAGVTATLPLVVTGSDVEFGTAIAPTTADTNADAVVGASAAGKKCLVLQPKASPTADAFQVQGSNGTIYFGVPFCGGVLSGTGNFLAGYNNTGKNLTSANNNTLIGSGSVTGTSFNSASNTIIGQGCCIATTFNSASNTVIGQGSGTGITSAASNTIIGAGAGNAVAASGSNTIVGAAANFGGSNGVVIGQGAGSANNTTSGDTIVGQGSGTGNNGGTNLTIFGSGSGTAISNGASNVIIGASTGTVLTTGNGNIFIGVGTQGESTGTTNTVSIGGNSSAITDFYSGKGINNAAPSDITFHPTNVSTATTDGAGVKHIIAAGVGTGAGVPAGVAIKYPRQLTTGTTQQSLSTQLYYPVTALFSTTADGSLTANVSTTGTVIGTIAGSQSLEGGIMTNGAVIRIKAAGKLTTSVGGPTLKLDFKLGSTVCASTGAQTVLSGVSNNDIFIDATVTCRSYGSTATTQGDGTLLTGSGSTLGLASFNLTSGQPDLTASNTIDLVATWSAGTAGNVITITSLTCTCENFK